MPNDNLRGRYRRDFTREPIGGSIPSTPPSQSQPTAPLPGEDQSNLNLPPSLADIKSAKHTRHRPVKRRRNFKKVILIILFLILLTGLGGGGYLYLNNKRATMPAVPDKVKAQTAVPVLYPNKLPAGYNVVPSSFNVSAGGIVAYYAEDNSGHRLNFTVQARPANFDFEAFYSRILTNATKFNTALGEAAVGTANGHLLGSLATTKSWVIVSGNSKAVGTDQIQTALLGIVVK